MAKSKRETDLENSLRAVLTAIETAEDNGCIEHLDAWDNSDEEWYEVLEEARGLIEEIDEEAERETPYGAG